MQSYQFGLQSQYESVDVDDKKKKIEKRATNYIISVHNIKGEKLDMHKL